MANNSGVQQFQPPQQQKPVVTYHCKDCGLQLNSNESLEVHINYHKENLLNKWATQAATSQHAEETNNNNTKANIKREFIANTIGTNDSSDSLKKSPEYSRTTPETIFGHPPTPQSYQSASSPYQNHDNSAFSPNFQNYQMKQERTSPNSHYQNNYPNYVESQFFEQPYQQEFPVNTTKPATYRYHHTFNPYDRPQSNSMPASSPAAYPPQPTPSPSPKQCDKCGYVCDSAAQLAEHQNIAHPPTPLGPFHPNQFHHFNDLQQPLKTEDDVQSEILDLDSHKVHQVYPEEEKRQNGEPNPHSVTALLNSWAPSQKMYQQQTQQYINGPPVQQDQKMFMHNQEFMGNNVVTTTQDNIMAQNYRAFEATPPAIASPQIANPPQPSSGASSTKSANWKSNEARRPKTYNCTACNKWFTSSGHLKRHYNTTLHKNAVKSSGQPDPASMPISAHHHPARDNASNKEDQSNSPGEEDTNSMPMPMMGAHPSMAHSSVSPPNGEAGPSPNSSLDSRGLLATHGFNMGHMMPIEPQAPQFQMYPNESAPHVTQVTDSISNLNITGEFIAHQDAVDQQEAQPLPSFAQFRGYGLLQSYGDANVGGGGPATAPFYGYCTDTCDTTESRTLLYRTEEEDYKLTVLRAVDAPPEQEELFVYENSAVQEVRQRPRPRRMPLERLRNNNNNNNHNNNNNNVNSKRDYEEEVQEIAEDVSSPQISSTTFETPFKCNNCDRFFHGACYLTQHNKTLHEGIKPFKCTRCGKRFSNEAIYEEHFGKHTKEKPHKCDRCPKQFNHKTDLRRHMCLHTGQKPFVCDTCGKGFIRKDHMLKHCETHLRKGHGRGK